MTEKQVAFPQGDRRHRRSWSLAAKGAAGLAVMAAFVIVVGAGIALERARLLQTYGELRQSYAREAALVAASGSLNQALIEITSASYASGDLALTRRELAAIEAAVGTLENAAREAPPANVWARRLAAVAQELRHRPIRSSWIDMRVTLREVREEVVAARQAEARRFNTTLDEFLRAFNLITIIWIAGAALGIALISLALGVFFIRLAHDLRLLERRAGEIVDGYRGVPMDLTRGDEVGRLAAAIDRMAVDLQARETRLELEEQARAYGDKMSALGALAAGVAHEVNNPLTAIASDARQLAERGEVLGERILRQTERAASATRRLADLAQSQPEGFEWVDPGDLLRRTLDLMRYDRRYRLVRFELSLEKDVPAIHTHPARLQQLLFSLLAHLAQAVAEGGAVRASCRPHGAGAEFVLADDRGREAAAKVVRAIEEPALPASRGALRIIPLAQAALAALGASLRAEAAEAGLLLTLRFPPPKGGD